MIDTFNHKNLKIVLIWIRYFNSNLEIQIKGFELTNLKGKTADILSNYISKSLKMHMLLDKIIAFYGNNCNTNFEGILKKQPKMFFLILNNYLKTNILWGKLCCSYFA